jgi:high-affinity iron transporter
MLLNSVVIVLREVLEAALMISILLVISRQLELKLRWLAVALISGLLGASVYARYLAAVSEMFDGVGQEIVNAALKISVAFALLIIVFLVIRQHVRRGAPGKLLASMMAVAVTLAASQESAEIIVYVTGFLQMKEYVSPVGFGALTGAGIGLSVGVLFYYLLLALPARRTLWLSVILLSLVTASMSIQAAKLLIQADWLAAAGPVWDTTWLVGEGSLPGQMLYALVGYEATPSLVEVLVYAGSLVVMLLVVAMAWRLPLDRSGESA